MESLFKIDNRAFSGVGVEKLNRSFRIADGPAAGVMMSGEEIGDVIGTYVDYKLTISTADMLNNEYDALFEVLSAPVESHTVEMPYGSSTLVFEARITAGTDELVPMDDGTWWGNLALSFRAKRPQRVPGGVA